MNLTDLAHLVDTSFNQLTILQKQKQEIDLRIAKTEKDNNDLHALYVKARDAAIVEALTPEVEALTTEKDD